MSLGGFAPVFNEVIAHGHREGEIDVLLGRGLEGLAEGVVEIVDEPVGEFAFGCGFGGGGVLKI